MKACNEGTPLVMIYSARSKPKNLVDHNLNHKVIENIMHYLLFNIFIYSGYLVSHSKTYAIDGYNWQVLTMVSPKLDNFQSTISGGNVTGTLGKWLAGFIDRSGGQLQVHVYLI